MALWDPASTDDPIEMLQAVTMAFIILLSRQPKMAMKIDRETMVHFPYEDFKLTAFEGPGQSQTFVLLRREELSVL